ncbi:MAG: hypothetical protein HN356_15575 [Calditrichaeota bacterium]|jgi:hypothetical protein|nr:hypothetical protein [Calditrichota bacterium]MBT7788346.1 hypothetical protein [Calditrichota bacterium]
MYKCPYCEKETITLWAKISTGPMSAATCTDCGKRSTTSVRAQMLALFPVVIGVFLPNYVPALMPFKFPIVVVVIVVSLLVYGMTAPLMKKS